MSQSPEQLEQNFNDLDYTQQIRKELITSLIGDAKSKSLEAVEAVAKLTADMDKVSIGRLKLNEKSKENETKANEAAVMANFLLSLNEKRRTSDHSSVSYSRSEQHLPDDLKPQYDPAVLDRSPVNETALEFQTRMEQN